MALGEPSKVMDDGGSEHTRLRGDKAVLCITQGGLVLSPVV